MLIDRISLQGRGTRCDTTPGNTIYVEFLCDSQCGEADVTFWYRLVLSPLPSGVFTCTHTYAHTDACMHAHTCTHACTHTHPPPTHTHTHTRRLLARKITGVESFALRCVHTHTCMHAHTHTHTHARTHAHTFYELSHSYTKTNAKHRKWCLNLIAYKISI